MIEARIVRVWRPLLLDVLGIGWAGDAADANHGSRRTNADKRQAVMTLLVDEEWGEWSNAEIARRCAVDEKTVRNYRQPVTSEVPKLNTLTETPYPTPRTYTTKHGTTARMNTGIIVVGIVVGLGTTMVMLVTINVMPSSSAQPSARVCKPTTHHPPGQRSRRRGIGP